MYLNYLSAFLYTVQYEFYSVLRYYTCVMQA